MELYINSSPASEWLLQGRKPEERYDQSALDERFRSLCVRAGIVPHISPHQLRHYFASVLLHAGVNLKIVSQLLGHATPSVTANIYWHLLDENERVEAYEKNDPLRSINEEMEQLAARQLRFNLKEI